MMRAGGVSHPWLTESRASSLAGTGVNSCQVMEASLAPPLATPGPGGKDATLYGRQDTCRHGY